MQVSQKTTIYFNIENKLDFLELLFQKRQENGAIINLIPFQKMTKWFFDDHEGNLRHETNGFFKIQSVKSSSTIQPIINQAEHGILGLLIKQIGGIIYCLVQMKIEPGNKDVIQISPTVQATESNYKGIHKGKKVNYIDYFIKESPLYKTIYKQLQSEQGSKFYKKRNWNIVIELDNKVDIVGSDNHYWLSLSLINDLLSENNVINMDLRSILSCFEVPSRMLEYKVNSIAWLNSYVPSGYNFLNEVQLREKLTQYKKNQYHEVELGTLDLALKNGWELKSMEIINPSNLDFIVRFIDVQIQNREVTSWTQPIVASKERKLNCLYVKKIEGTYHYLFQFCNEIGLTTYVEIGPTFHNVDINNVDKYPYANLYKSGKILFESVLSEEGGRFYHEENIYTVIELPENINIELLPNYYWGTLYSVKSLLKKACKINIEARTLLATFDWRLIGYEEN